MAIEFHCDHCGKLVRAPDDAGGKRGRCPACHQSVYIPTPPEQLEPLDLAPVDETEEQQRARLLRETFELERRVYQDSDIPPESAAAPPPAGSPAPPVLDVETLVIEYAQAMAAGKLEEAEQLAADIRRNMDRANDVIQRLMTDEILPEPLAEIPRPVLVGFFKQLKAK